MCADTLGLSTLRRDAYTGPNRCWPCTALNVAILAVTAVVVGWATVALVGVAVAVAGFAAVWLRGYLVPYTPRVTGRVLPVLPGDRFGHATPPPGAPSETAATEGGDSDQSNPKATPAVYGQGVSAGSTHGAAGAAVVEELLAADVLVDEGTTLALASAFHEAWRATIVDLRETESSPEMLATGLSAVIPWVADASVVTDDGRQWI
ncbi:MAG: hypothetical protein RI560_07435, partial [Natronomonas sp.]|nr:hypothetical protein [Natronomonas sp.]